MEKLQVPLVFNRDAEQSQRHSTGDYMINVSARQVRSEWFLAPRTRSSLPPREFPSYLRALTFCTLGVFQGPVLSAVGVPYQCRFRTSCRCVTAGAAWPLQGFASSRVLKFVAA
jgi:hypothetical protein